MLFPTNPTVADKNHYGFLSATNIMNCRRKIRSWYRITVIAVNQYMSSLSSSVAAHCIQHVNGIVLNNSGGRSRKESLSSMKVISKVSDSGTGATVYYSYSFRHFSFVDTKQTRHTERTKWEKGEKHRDREVQCVVCMCTWGSLQACLFCLLKLGKNMTLCFQ